MSNAPNGAPDYGTGFLEISEKGFGFLRTPDNNFQPKPSDIFVTPDTIKRSFLREGAQISGPTQPPHRGNSPQLRSVDKVNGVPFADYTKQVRFENITRLIQSKSSIWRLLRSFWKPASSISSRQLAKAPVASSSRRRGPARRRF